MEVRDLSKSEERRVFWVGLECEFKAEEGDIL